MTAIAERTAPGVYTMPEADYHAATWALSSTGCKAILDCPARFRYEQDHPVRKKVFDLGSAAHKLVLGAGPRVQVVNAADWRTAAAKEARSRAYEAGCIPVLRHDWDTVQAMAAALRAEPDAAALFDHGNGKPEQSLFWTHDATGVPRRARLDWLPAPRPGGRMVIADYKTCDRADPATARKAIGNFGYHIQHATYTEGVQALGMAEDPAFLFVFQEREPPFLVNVIQLDPAAVEAGRAACAVACERFRDCTAAGVWPGYMPPGLAEYAEISLPPWAARIPETYEGAAP